MRGQFWLELDWLDHSAQLTSDGPVAGGAHGRALRVCSAVLASCSRDFLGDPVQALAPPLKGCPCIKQPAVHDLAVGLIPSRCRCSTRLGARLRIVPGLGVVTM